ncbi:MAG: hypothetical protein IJM01_00105 [Eubacterium sp.]|nr:hypothetical protein [Eubacterium sp.]
MNKSRSETSKRKHKLFNRELSLLVYEIRRDILHESQLSFSERCCLSQKTISRMENAGETDNFSLDSIYAITDGTHIRLSDFFSIVEKNLMEKEPSLQDETGRSSPFYEAYPDKCSSDNINRMMILLQAAGAIMKLIDAGNLSFISDEDLELLKRLIA